MRLINLSLFEPIFEPLSGLTVGIVDGIGNIGEQLLYLAARQYQGAISYYFSVVAILVFHRL